MNKPVRPVVIIGCGYIGKLVARHYQSLGQPVSALVRSPESAERLQSEGIKAVPRDLSKPVDLGLQTGDAELFVLMPPPAQGTTDLHMQHLLEALDRSAEPNLNGQPAPPHRIVYISTTGVYGDCNGQWVDEHSPVNPQVDRAHRRYDAEQQLQAWAKSRHVDAIIVRVAGIYGPGKLPLKRLAQQQPVIRESEAPFTNRIHAHDLVSLLIAAMQRGQAGAIYHGCDGQPGTMTDYFKQVAAAAGLPAPAEISLAEGQTQLSAGMMSYMRESRRLRNAFTLQQLGLSLQYPSLEAGLAQCFANTDTGGPAGD